MIVAITGAMLAPSSHAQMKQLPPGSGFKASPSEIPFLPKFCWWVYTEFRGPEYEMRGCGPFMNHYCWGLTELLRAQRTFGDQQTKISYLKQAKQTTLGALRDMNDYPACAFREHAQNTLRTVDLQLQALRAR
jgi:hypothetical protein